MTHASLFVFHARASTWLSDARRVLLAFSDDSRARTTGMYLFPDLIESGVIIGGDNFFSNNGFKKLLKARGSSHLKTVIACKGKTPYNYRFISFLTKLSTVLQLNKNLLP